MIRIYNTTGDFLRWHVSSGIQPGMLFMYHGWDPKMLRVERTVKHSNRRINQANFNGRRLWPSWLSAFGFCSKPDV